MADWPKADGTRIEVGSEIARVAGDTDLKGLDVVDLARRFAWCDSQRAAQAALVELSGGGISTDKARELVEKALESRLKTVRDHKSDHDVTLEREAAKPAAKK